MTELNAIETDVLVIGAGPAGLAMAGLLAELGIDTVTVTKYGGTAHSPRAHITNQRTMEVFRDLGIEDDVREVATPNELMGNNVWSTSFTDPEIARLLTWGSGPERRSDYDLASPSQMCNIPQHILEPVMLRGATGHGADVRFDTELVDLTQDADGVTATVKDRGTGEQQTIRAKYAVGADGGRSTVAELLDFSMDGTTGLGAAVNVWLEADLTAYTAHRPGTLYWMCQPGNDYWVGSGTWICVKPWTEWVMLYMYDPAQGEPDLSEEAVIARARTTIGDPDVDIKVKAISQWQINHVVAETYQQGRVFLAGDAAHRHPPANGLGTNTSIQDSFNLAWKLAYVLRGLAGPALLDTYDAERQPVGRQVVDRAMKSVGDMLPISQALGFAPGQSSDDGWKALDDLFLPGPDGEVRRKALDEAVALQNYQFNCHGVELDQHYESSAVADDDTPWPTPDRDPELFHHPTTHPGARLPHAWLEHEGRQVSTLDLVGHGAFTLLTGIGGEAWADAAAKAATELGVPLNVRTLGHHSEYDDVLGRWAELREVEDTGCLLVRPDHHVAWRSTRLTDDPQGDLVAVLRRTLASDA
ncbi:MULTISPECIES: FAD-dependent monooxygenase [unclassified Nocardioides]|uniref:FAD-dependent monooxygenase n=1 Tax=unclassified Nocardioides TaxID=2615069 RepID=UPI000701B332|nr:MULTISPECIES: FAD-dependent monooxygenase [unclassified Nocardioides]KQY56775.1 2,4-dichlorophenol 6-monooxygenase [Nocardioides sp. Root140]KRF12895.1 2,4-dichlorophenol 6-monooxygenase [Nocardioides sp. Soil796]